MVFQHLPNSIIPVCNLLDCHRGSGGQTKFYAGLAR